MQLTSSCERNCLVCMTSVGGFFFPCWWKVLLLSVTSSIIDWKMRNITIIRESVNWILEDPSWLCNMYSEWCLQLPNRIWLSLSSLWRKEVKRPMLYACVSTAIYIWKLCMVGSHGLGQHYIPLWVFQGYQYI